MPQTNTWLVETIEALQDLNSESSVKEICLQIKKRNKMNFSSNPKWLSTVSHYIQRNCEGYRLFLGSSDPLFKKIKFGNRVKFSLIEFSSDNVREQVLDYELNGFPEGKEKFIKHLSYERRPLVIAIAKENFKEANDGQIFCEIYRY
jgi:predicted HNH restriction endonuclease